MQMSEKWRRESVNQQIPFVYPFPGYCYCYGYYYQTPTTFGYSSKKIWRATTLPVDLAAFKKERNRVMNLMNEARLVKYNQFIEDNSTDRRRLFVASKSLMNMKKDRSPPPHSDVSLLANDMGQFFIAKITNIRSKLDGILPSHPPLSTPEPNLESESGDIVFSHFQCQAWLRQFVIWLHLERTSPASSCLDSLLPAITNMVNLSLQTGYFAETWKTAVVYPSLKKPGLDLLFKNFVQLANCNVRLN